MPFIRETSAGDLPGITAIYAHHVLTGTATFEEVPPSVDEMHARHEKVRALGLPWLVAEDDGVLVGFAYAAPFRERSAYRYTLEDSVYVDPGQHRRGTGRALMAELISRCEGLGYRQMIAAIGDSANAGSIGLHAAMGFEPAGVYRNVGLKFGRWLDVVLMQKTLGVGAANVPR
jgi:L-amino acid N-acyltransferase YncA